MSKPVPVYLTVDIVLLAGQDILLIRRKNEPFINQWALPGGFVDPGENLEEAALRELEEETGISFSAERLKQIGAFGEPERDPRGRTVSVAYCISLHEKPLAEAGSDASDVSWFPLKNLPKLAFDHADIIGTTLNITQHQ